MLKGTKQGAGLPQLPSLPCGSHCLLPNAQMMPFHDQYIRCEALRKVSLGSSEFKLISFKEDGGESRGDEAAAKKVKHLEITNDLLICVPNTNVIYTNFNTVVQRTLIVYYSSSSARICNPNPCFFFFSSSMSPKPDCVTEQNQIKSQNEVTYSRKEKSNMRKAHTLAKIFNMAAIKSFSNCISK